MVRVLTTLPGTCSVGRRDAVARAVCPRTGRHLTRRLGPLPFPLTISTAGVYGRGSARSQSPTCLPRPTQHVYSNEPDDIGEDSRFGENREDHSAPEPPQSHKLPQSWHTRALPGTRARASPTGHARPVSRAVAGPGDGRATGGCGCRPVRWAVSGLRRDRRSRSSLAGPAPVPGPHLRVIHDSKHAQAWPPVAPGGRLIPDGPAGVGKTGLKPG
jgi:hypothetical protein